MSRTRTHLMSWLGGVLLLGACGESKGPEASSETHWLCESSTECEAYDPKAACVGGYCEDESGQRLLASLKPDEAASGGQGATGGADAGFAAVGGGAGGIGAGGMSDAGADAGVGDFACTDSPASTASADVHQGSYLVTTPESLETARALTEITGDLEVGTRLGDAIQVLALPNLQRLGGDLSVQGAALEQLNLPNLTSVGGQVSVSLASRLVETDLRRLSDVAGDVYFSNNAQHIRLRLDSLESVGGSLLIEDEQLAACEVDAAYAAVGQMSSGIGRSDCSCDSGCPWLEVACP